MRITHDALRCTPSPTPNLLQCGGFARYNWEAFWIRRAISITGGITLEPNELARKVVEIASDRKAEDIVMLDISKVSIIADYFVICTGTGDRHVRAIAKEIDEQLGHEKLN